MVFSTQWNESAKGVHVSPHSEPPSQPYGLSQWTGFEYPVLFIKVNWSSISDMVIYMFQCYSLKSSHPCLFLESKILFLTSVSLLLSYIYGHCYHFPKFHICINILYWCFSFWFTSLYIIGSNFIHLIRTDSNVFLFYSWVIFHCVYVPQLSYPFICWLTSRLLPCPKLLQTVLQWTLGYMYLFQFCFSWCVCSAVGLLGRMAVLFPGF